MSRWLGAILVLVSAASFGFMPLFASWAKDVSVPMMLMLRFAAAAAVLAGICVLRRERFPRGRLLLVLLAMGALGYFGEAYIYFSALAHAPSGMVSLLLYTYPAIVTVLSVAVLKERLTPVGLIALALAVVGTALMVVPGLLQPESIEEPRQRTEPIGVVMGLACALSYSIYVIVGSRLPKTIGALPQSVLVCTGAAAMFALVVIGRAARGSEPFPHSAQSWSGVLALALICTVIGVTMFLAGLARVGPVRASTLSTFEPVMTAAVGVIALGETFGLAQIIGGVLILAAAVLSARSHRPLTPKADGAVATS
jgi:drug/metabolite transporter (DMT)-like permease